MESSFSVFSSTFALEKKNKQTKKQMRAWNAEFQLIDTDTYCTKFEQKPLKSLRFDFGWVRRQWHFDLFHLW